jgi:hypothetical protein
MGKAINLINSHVTMYIVYITSYRKSTFYMYDNTDTQYLFCTGALLGDK